LRNNTYYCVVGLSYKNADLSVRGSFSLNKSKTDLLLSRAKADGVEELMVISTCNRTELMGKVENPEILINYLCTFSGGDPKLLATKVMCSPTSRPSSCIPRWLWFGESNRGGF